MFFFGPTQLSSPSGNGFLGAGEGVARINPGVATEFLGTASVNLDKASSTGILIAGGSTWNFQFWFRDVQAGGAMFNTSDALSIVVCP